MGATHVESSGSLGPWPPAAEELRARTAAPHVDARRNLDVRDCPRALLARAPCRRLAHPRFVHAGKALRDSKLARMPGRSSARPPAIEEPQTCKRTQPWPAAENVARSPQDVAAGHQTGFWPLNTAYIDGRRRREGKHADSRWPERGQGGESAQRLSPTGRAEDSAERQAAAPKDEGAPDVREGNDGPTHRHRFEIAISRVATPGISSRSRPDAKTSRAAGDRESARNEAAEVGEGPSIVDTKWEYP